MFKSIMDTFIDFQVCFAVTVKLFGLFKLNAFACIIIFDKKSYKRDGDTEQK